MESLTAAEIAKRVGGQVEGEASRRFTGIASLAEATADEVSFWGSAAFERDYAATRAGAVLVPRSAPARNSMTLIRVDDPVRALDALVVSWLPAARQPAPGIHPSAVVAADARIDPAAHVGPYCVVGAGCLVGARSALMSHVVLEPGAMIGEDTVLWPFVCVREHCRIGSRGFLHPGVAVGFDGFGFDPVDGRWLKNPQRGTVEIGDDVEIGANATIARARFGCTRIGNGVKIDADTHVGHNTQIGDHTYVGAMSGFGGTTRVGARCVIAPQCATVPQVEIPPGSMLAGRTVVTKSLKEPGSYWGFPAQPMKDEKRQRAAVQRVDEMRRELADLKKRIEALETPTHDRPAR